MNKPFIVAEMSGNHMGTLDGACTLLFEAKKAGADAVKLQTWTPGTMCLDERYIIPSGPWKGMSLAALYDSVATPWGWHAPLFELGHNLGIEVFSTAFDIEALKFLESLSCPRYKIASFEITDLRLIHAVAETRKPMMISTGMATNDEISWAFDAAYDEVRNNHVTLLKCTSAYPADAQDANLLTIEELRDIYDDVGLSDHTPGIGVAVAAVALGASVIEKHFTLSRAAGGEDAAFSMEPEEFAQMVVECRRAAAAMGEVRYGATEAELPQLALRRSLHYARALPAGHVIGPGDIVTSRPNDGLHCHKFPLTQGAIMLKEVRRGAPVRAGDMT